MVRRQSGSVKVLVKGISRRVIVIKSPDPQLFEEAIFIVKDDALKKGVTQEEIVMQAQSVANDYVRTNICGKPPKLKIPPIAYTIAGAAVTGLIWLGYIIL